MARAEAPKDQPVQTLLTQADKDALDGLCRIERVNVSEMVRDIIKDRLREHPSLYVASGHEMPGQLGLFERGSE